MATTLVHAQPLHREEKDALGALVDDILALRTALLLVTAKLDADAGVTDTNYTALCTPAAAKVAK